LIRIFTDNREEKVALADLPSMTPKNQQGLIDPYAEELAQFIHCLISGEAFRVKTEEARLAVDTVHKLQQRIS
jgi:hypothetical protein